MTSTAPPTAEPRWKRWSRRGLFALLFVVAAVVSAAVHLDTPAGRVLATQAVNRFVSADIRGRLHVTSIKSLSLASADLESLELYDPAEERVLHLLGLRVEFDSFELLQTLLFSSTDPRITLPHLRLEKAEVRLLRDESSGKYSLQLALQSQRPRKPKAKPTPGPTWNLPNIEIGHADASVELSAERSLHGTLNRARASVEASDNKTLVVLERLGADVWLADLAAPAAPIDEAQKFRASGTGAARIEVPGEITASFQGFLGDIELQLSAHLVGDNLEADISLPRITSAAARQYWEGWPLEAPCSARAHATGTLPNLEVQADIEIGDRRRKSTIEAHGSLNLGEPLQAEFETAVERVDLRDFFPDAPRTSIGAELRGKWGPVPDGQGSGALSLTGSVQPGRFGGQALPHVDLELDASTLGVSLDAGVFEEGAPARAHVTIDPQGLLQWTVDVQQLDLKRWQRFQHRHAGSGDLHSTGTLNHGLLDATLDAALSNVRFKPEGSDAISAQRLTTHARITGNIEKAASLQVQGQASVETLTLSGFHIRSGKAMFRGNLAQLETEISLVDADGRELSLEGSWVDLSGSHPELRNAEASLIQGPFKISGTIQRFAPTSGIIEIDPLTMAGAGATARGHLRLRPTSLDAKFSSRAIDLARLAQTLGLPSNYVRGLASIQMELIAGEDVTRGQVSADLEKVSVMGFGRVSAKLRSSLDERALTGSIEGQDAVAGKFAGSFDVDLAGSPLEFVSYLDATGSGRLQVQSIALDPLSLLLSEDSLVQDLSGDLGAEIQIHRPNPNERAIVFYNVGTTAIQLSAKNWFAPDKLSNPRAHFGGMLNFQTGDVKASALLFDDKRELLSLTATARSALLTRIATEEGALLDFQQELRSMPIDAVVSLAPRPIESLPLRDLPEGLTGDVSANLSVRGSFDRPQLFTTISASQLHSSLDPQASAINLQVQAGYAPKATGSPRLQAKADVEHQGHNVAQLQFSSNDIDLSQAEWQGSLKLSGLPASVIPTLAQSEIDTTFHGAVQLGGSPGKRRMDAKLQLRPVRVQSTDYGQIDISIEGRQNTYSGVVTQRPSAVDNPSLTANILARSTDDELMPSHFQIALNSKQMPAGLIAPILEPVATRISGWVDGDFAIVLQRAQDQHWSTRIDGSGTLTGGSTHIPDLGLTLTNVEATTVARSAGNRTSFAFTGLKATARASKPNITGDLNLVLEDLKVTGGMGFVEMDEVPLTFQGVSRGTGTGNVALQLERDENLMLVTLGLPNMHVRLPQSSSRDLVPLEANQEISVAQYDDEEEKEADPNSLAWRLVLKLGDDVRVTRADAHIPIEGEPVIDFGAKTRLSGVIQLKQGGRIPVLGKVLQVEQGSVRLNPEDSGNPTLDVTASWRSPEGIMIFVHVDGPWRENRPPQLSSNPPLPETELMALLLGGSSSSSDNQGPASEQEGVTTGGAVAFGGGVAASGVSQILGEQLSDVELRVDAPSETSGYGAAAAVRLGPKLWFETSYERANHAVDPAASDNIVTGTLDYRFTRRWSLRTAVGTAGGTLDLLWQYRY